MYCTVPKLRYKVSIKTFDDCGPFFYHGNSMKLSSLIVFQFRLHIFESLLAPCGNANATKERWSKYVTLYRSIHIIILPTIKLLPLLFIKVN